MGDGFSSGWKGSKAPSVQSQKLNAAIYPSSVSIMEGLSCPETKGNSWGSSGQLILPQKLPALLKEFLAEWKLGLPSCSVSCTNITSKCRVSNICRRPYSADPKSTGSGAGTHWRESLENYLLCLCLSFFTCKMEKINHLPFETIGTIWR